MEKDIIRIKVAPPGYIYVHRRLPKFAEAIVDTREDPTYTDNFKLIRHLSAEEQEAFRKKLTNKEI